MKIWKKISIMFVYPVLLLGTGFLGGMVFLNYFYPGIIASEQGSQSQEQKWQQISGEVDESGSQIGTNVGSRDSENAGSRMGTNLGSQDSANAGNQDGINVSSQGSTNAGNLADSTSGTNGSAEGELLGTGDGSQSTSEDSVQTSIIREKLNADTSYVLEETDMRNDTVVETVWKLPAKYIGMNREEFIEAMEIYEASPPLEELERGFVSLEVLSFSPQKVVVQMNYEYMQPGESFYLMVVDNYVVVYLEDRETVYMDTDILLTELPEELQQEIIQVMFIPDEESLYNFLENYSS